MTSFLCPNSYIGSATYNHQQTVTTANKSNLSETTTLALNGFINASAVEETTTR